jgi:hypothetical protein
MVEKQKRSFRLLLKTLTLACVLTLLASLVSNRSIAQGTDTRWVNPAGGNWNVPTNWDNGVPDATKNAVIDLAGTYTVTLDVDATVASLRLGGSSGTQTFALGGGVMLTLNGASTVNSNGVINQAGGTLTGSGNLTVNGVYSWTYGTQDGSGTTVIAANSTLNMSGDPDSRKPKKVVGRTLTNNGTAVWTGTDALLFDPNGIFNNNGTLDLQSDANAGNIAREPSFGFNNAGTLTKSAGTGTSAIGVLFNNSGTVNANSGTLRFDSTYTQTAGATRLNDGSISLTNFPMDIQGGSLEGNGTVSGNVSNSGGAVKPGLSPGALTINGNYTQGAAGAFNVEIGGLTAGAQFDQLNVTESATLTGTLNVTLINGFVPSLGNTFQILNYASRSGTFSGANLPSLPGPLGWEVRYETTSVTLAVVLLQPPVITSINPTSGQIAAQIQTFAVNGANLTGATAINFLLNGNPDPNITVSNLTVVNDTRVTATVNIGRDAQAGNRVVIVTTPAGASSSAAGANNTFTVQVALPALAGNRVLMVSVPINASNLDPLTVFGANAQVARYTGNNQYLLRSSSFFPVSLGEGYFVKLPSDFTPTLATGTLAPNNAPFDVALPDNDWFIVGNPFLGAVSFDVNQLQFVIGGAATPLSNVVGDVNGAVTFYGWKWNPDRNDYDLVCDPNVIAGAVSTLGVGEAIFVRTQRAGVSLRIPVPTGHPQLAKRSKRQRAMGEWSFRLTTSAGSVEDANTFLGVSTQGKGQGVKVEMPPALLSRQGYVETSIIGTLPDGKAQRFKADLKPMGGQNEAWDIEVRTNLSNAPVTLKWGNLSQVPRQSRLRLVDLATGEKRAMRTSSGYLFRSNADGETVRRFRVELYPASEGGLRVQHLNVVAQGSLGAHVSFALSQPARVQMTILSPTGKAVRILPPMEAKVGLNALTWDGKSQAGASLACGPYLVLLRAVDEEGQEVQATRSMMMR